VTFDVPVGRFLSLAQDSGTDPDTAWGAIEVALSATSLKASDRDKAFSILEGLISRRPGHEVYEIRMVCHLLRWPDKYAERAKRLAQSHSGGDNSLAAYALVGCALAQKDKAGALKLLLAAQEKKRFGAYELEALRARAAALEKVGYSRFSALAFSLFQRKIPHAGWLGAISMSYEPEIKKELEGGKYEDAGKVLQALLLMAQRAHSDARTVETEIASLNMGRRTLLGIVDLRGRLRDPVGVRNVQQEISDLEARKELMQEYLGRRNAAFFDPLGAHKKSEQEWITFFTAVLNKGEVEAISTDRMMEGPAPRRTIHLTPGAS